MSYRSENGARSGESAGRRVLTSRRRFLEAAGAAGLIGAGGLSLAQQTTTYEFGGEVSGWQGQSPSAIEGETNPTLELEAGTEYEVVWENLDGLPHDFVVQDADGERLVGTEVVSEEGATTTLTFTATEEMTRYICTIHPSSMVGDIEVGAGGAGGQQAGQAQRFVPAGPSVGVEQVADGPLTNPVTLRSVPGTDGTQFVVDQPGRIYALEDGNLDTDPVLDIRERVEIRTEEGAFDERGLLGLDFHPDFEENDQLYVRYSAAEPAGDSLVGPGDREFPQEWDHVEVLAEFQLSGDDLQIDPDSERILLEVPEPQFNHNGGEVTFGPDGYLYTSLGDGGAANDVGLGHVADWYDGNEGGNAQNVTANLLGKVLRLDVDSEPSETARNRGGGTAGQEGEDTPYAVPDDNPLVGTDGYDEIYAWGLRNPWRMSFNDGSLVAADVGQNLFEEVDVIESGGNYGWNVREGFHCFDAANPTEPPEECPTTATGESPYDGQELRDPVLEYPHTFQGESVGISISGGYVYGGEDVSALSGQYVFGDWSTDFSAPHGRVFAATPQGLGETAVTPEDGRAGNATGRNATDGNQTDGNATGDAIENVTVGQEVRNATDGNATGANATGANETGTEAAVQTDIDLQRPSEQPWQYQEVRIEGGENGELNRFVQAFGRDADGNIYVLASRTGRVTGDAGEIYRIVPPGEGEEISQPDIETPTPGGGDGESEE